MQGHFMVTFWILPYILIIFQDDSGALEYEEFIEIVIGNRRRREELEKTASQDSS